MSRITTLTFVSIALSAGLLSGCASDDSAMSYSSGQMRKAQVVQIGTVLSVQPVKVKGSSNPLLTVGGAALGGLAGSTMGGSSRASAAGAVAGALVGGAGAEVAQRQLSKKAALEITVKLDSGPTISIVQDQDVPLVAGQRVRVLTGGGTDRVVPY